jgi:5'-3' exonuclease
MNVHLIDGTYELFRHYFAMPPGTDVSGNEVGAVRGVLMSVLGLLDSGATHVGVATDHVIESFRNQLYAGYKTSDGVPPQLMSQFPILEEALVSMGVMVWPMQEFEADDALASAAAKAAQDSRVEKVFICTPDKDLAQCVVDSRVVQLDRMRNIERDAAAVVTKWGVSPESIPDYLAVVGDSADGFPGLAGWGPKAAGTMFSQFPHLEDIPKDWRRWPSALRGSQRLASVLFETWNDAILFRTLATLRTDAPVFDDVEDLRWSAPTEGFGAFCKRLRAPVVYEKALHLSERS